MSAQEKPERDALGGGGRLLEKLAQERARVVLGQVPVPRLALSALDRPDHRDRVRLDAERRQIGIGARVVAGVDRGAVGGVEETAEFPRGAGFVRCDNRTDQVKEFVRLDARRRRSCDFGMGDVNAK